jgi:predicted nucleotidyltransferase
MSILWALLLPDAAVCSYTDSIEYLLGSVCLTGVCMEISIREDELRAFCRRHRIHRLALFGSVLREGFRPDSDVDVLVDFEEGAEPGLFDLVGIQEELSEILGRQVDLVERQAVERSENYIRRRHILDSAETVYVAG